MPGRRSIRVWPLAVLLLAVAVLGQSQLDNPSARLPDVPELGVAPGSTASVEDCTQIIPTRLDGSVWAGVGDLLLASNDVVRFHVCSSGTLSLSARGSALAGVGAYLVVSQSDQNLWEGEVMAPTELELDVPAAGWVAITFTNDRYEPPEDRNIWLQSLEFRPRESGVEPQEPPPSSSHMSVHTVAAAD